MNERELLLTSIRGCRRVDLYVDPAPLLPHETERLAVMESRRLAGEPLQYILGECDFMGLTLKVDPRVLIPRPETEILVDTAVQMIKGQGVASSDKINILDVGTGSGSIAVALAKNFPLSAITTIDISADALALARENAVAHHVSSQIRFVLADMREYFGQISTENMFDVIISNPPYIPTGQLRFLPRDVQQEPWSALDGGEDGLYYLRQIIQSGQNFLKPGGLLFLELGDGQSRATIDLLNTTSVFPKHGLVQDYVGTDRIVWAQRI